jgi:hypothetical protein
MFETKSYAPQARNATSVNILRSWIAAVGIPVRPSSVPGFDLSVTQKDGGTIEVQVCMRSDETMPGEGIQVLAKDITSKRLSTALDAFWRITDAAGYDRRDPLNRGAEPPANEKGNPRKLHYKDEDFLVAIRHTEFRRSPNPTNDKWVKYRSNMEKVACGFHRMYYEVCRRHGLGIDDLMQYARCFVVNFCARYECTNEVWFDNERKCYRYLQQRFKELLTILLKKERSTIPDGETVSLALYGIPNASLDSVHFENEPEEIDYDYIDKHCELDTSSPAKRRASAAEKLRNLLNQLPNDQRIEVLKNAANSKNLDVAARKEATRLLHEFSSETSDLRV